MPKQKVSETLTIKASASKIFDLICDPKKHLELDGNAQLTGLIEAPERLSLGAKFSMNLKVGAKYHVTNTVVVFEENKTIAWQHLAKHIWRYDLVDNGDGTTQVTESWDWGPFPLLVRLGMSALQFPAKNKQAMKLTLKKIASLVE
jgi:hypothetical protein